MEIVAAILVGLAGVAVIGVGIWIRTRHPMVGPSFVGMRCPKCGGPVRRRIQDSAYVAWLCDNCKTQVVEEGDVTEYTGEEVNQEERGP